MRNSIIKSYFRMRVVYCHSFTITTVAKATTSLVFIPNKCLQLMILFTNKAFITNTPRQLSAVRRCQFETLFEKPIEIEFSY